MNNSMSYLIINFNLTQAMLGVSRFLIKSHMQTFAIRRRRLGRGQGMLIFFFRQCLPKHYKLFQKSQKWRKL